MNSNLYNTILNACKKSIFESLFSNDLNITIEEAREDYDMLDYADSATKKALSTKYNIDSKKSKEILQQILLYIRDLRTLKNDFSIEDEKDFNRLTNCPSRYDKAAEFYKEEGSNFLNYLLSVYEKSANEVLSKKYSCNVTGLSIADKYKVDRYKNLKRYLDESNPSSNLNKHKNDVDIIIEKLNELLVDFKQYYMDNIKKTSTKFYNDLPKLIEKLLLKYSEIRKEKDDYCIRYKEANNNSSFGIYYDSEYKRINKNYEQIANQINLFKTILKKFETLDLYISNELEEGENHFKEIVASLAERINEKNLNLDNLKISNVNYDPKLFEMFITDGEKRLYARSIWAAEDSTYMIAHFRFIITNA